MKKKEGTVVAGTEAASEAIARGTVLATDGTGTGIADVTEILTEVIATTTAIETATAMKERGTAVVNALKMTTFPTSSLQSSNSLLQFHLQ